jgi:predicted DNA-binding WGR domain protein
MSELSGKTVVFTGTLKIPRAEATKKAEQAGAKVTAAISGKTDIVVVGESAGSKAAEAKAKGIAVWTEAEFLENLAAKKAPAPKGKKAAAAAAAEKEGAVAKPAAKPAGKKGKAPAKTAHEEDPSCAADGDEPPKKVQKTEPAVKPSPLPAAPPAVGGGRRPVDREVPDRGSYTIVDDWSINLNQTNIGGNNNKYYIIQVLQGKGQFWAWNRWGRQGEPGQHKLEGFPSLAGATASFMAKFKDKTGNQWNDRHNFTPRTDKYSIVETEEKDGEGDASAPMGKLSKAQIEKGQSVLEELAAAITGGKNASSLVVDLSSRFFTLIPTNFGRSRPEPIRTIEKLREKEELLKFYLRMGFETPEQPDGALTPIAGVMNLPIPATLLEAIAGACPAPSVTSSVNQGSQLAAKQAGKPVSPMNKEEYGSIMLYTSNAIYKDLNKVLRDENRAGVRRYFSYLRLLFAATDKLPKNNVTLWRGIGVDLFEQYKVGSVITWWGVSSCTSDQQVARNFMNGCGGNCSFLTIDTKTAVDISAITFYSNEKESLLLPGTQLLVKSAKRNGKVAEIHLEEVGRQVS